MVVLGISVSFWVNEWSEERVGDSSTVHNAFELLDDLNIDATRIERLRSHPGSCKVKHTNHA